MKRLLHFWREKVREVGRLAHRGDKSHKQKIKENEGYHGVCADWTKINTTRSRCCPRFPIAVSVSVCCCFLSSRVIEFNLRVTSLLGLLLPQMKLGVCLRRTKELLCFSNSACPAVVCFRVKEALAAEPQEETDHLSQYLPLINTSIVPSFVRCVCVCRQAKGQRARIKAGLLFTVYQ